MGSKSQEYREDARRLEEQSKAAPNETVREALLVAAQWRRELADEIERYEVDTRERP
jgi:hypothetical protein